MTLTTKIYCSRQYMVTGYTEMLKKLVLSIIKQFFFYYPNNAHTTEILKCTFFYSINDHPNNILKPDTISNSFKKMF
jgi:hypothetical protein